MELLAGLLKWLLKNTSAAFLLLVVMLFSGCGKNEGAGGALGAAGGGLIGNVVAGKNSKAAGTLIGGLLGGIVGSSLGRAADEEEELDRTVKKQERIAHARQIECLQEENERLRRDLVKWCSGCGRRCELAGACSCACCGSPLIREKFCHECKTIFSPRSGYQYCPYCRGHVLLCGR